jgi:hypothetical protein
MQHFGVPALSYLYPSSSEQLCQPLKDSFCQATSSQTAKEYGRPTFCAKDLGVML